MAGETNSPYMSLPIPGVGITDGPQYAIDINACLNIIDQHNHTTGLGVPIPTAGLNINADLSFGNNNLTNPRSIRFQAQGSPLAGADDVGCLYEAVVDLYYNDGDGNQIRLTQGGALAGTPGSISGLTSPASASYVALSSTFVWQSNINTPANMDGASYILRNLSANSKALTLSPPAAMGADYTITLPALPASTEKFVSMDTTGAMFAHWAIDSSTLVISANVLKVADGGITATQLASNSVSTVKIQDGAVTAAKLASGIATLTTVSFPTSSTWTAPAGVTQVIVTGRGGSGGGGSGGRVNAASGGNSNGGGGGGGACTSSRVITVVPATVYTITIGAAGAGAGATSGFTSGSAGTDGGDSTFGSLLTFKGAKGGAGGVNASSTVSLGGTGIFASGGNGGNDSINSTPGFNSFFAAGGASSAGNDGGGGGAGDGAGGAGAAANTGSSGSAGTSGGGGGGGGAGYTGAAGGAGGNGTAGVITVSYTVGS